MSPEEDKVVEIAAIAAQLAPCFTGGLDFSSRGPAWGNPGEPSDYEKLATRSFTAAEVFINDRDKRLTQARIEAGIRRAEDAKRAKAQAEDVVPEKVITPAPKAKKEAANG